MSETPPTPGGTPVSDHRPVPRGVLPRGIQTWLMVGLAGGMLLIILVAGRPTTPAPRTSSAPVSAPSADRARDYQGRLRALEAQAMQEAQSAPSAPASPAKPEQPQSHGSEDALAAERKRREYESRFASNIAFSRRAGADQASAPGRAGSHSAIDRESGTSPSIDEIADAVVRATAKAGAGVPAPQIARAAERAQAETKASATAERGSRPAHTDRISAAGPLHRVLEGTVIETALTNRLDGSGPAPVNCLVTTPLYSHGGQRILIPIGARVLGDSKPVQAQGESRLAVAFHRLVLPDGSTFSLDLYPGLNQIGDAGLRDLVNQHYWSIFGAAAAVGLVSGFAQAVSAASANVGTRDRTVVITGSASETTAQATMQVMNRFLNRLPTVTIREGHRVQIYLTSDLELPAYEPPQLPSGF
jgi:type IV secretion system protein TrbI